MNELAGLWFEGYREKCQRYPDFKEADFPAEEDTYLGTPESIANGIEGLIDDFMGAFDVWDGKGILPASTMFRYEQTCPELSLQAVPIASDSLLVTVRTACHGSKDYTNSACQNTPQNTLSTSSSTARVRMKRRWQSISECRHRNSRKCKSCSGVKKPCNGVSTDDPGDLRPFADSSLTGSIEHPSGRLQHSSSSRLGYRTSERPLEYIAGLKHKLVPCLK